MNTVDYRISLSLCLSIHPVLCKRSPLTEVRSDFEGIVSGLTFLPYLPEPTSALVAPEVILVQGSVPLVARQNIVNQTTLSILEGRQPNS
jgi:hypothetical protein